MEKREIAWYEGQSRELQLASQQAVWFHFGKPPLPITWVLVHEPLAEHESICLLSTDLALSPHQILEFSVSRWQIEITFEESRRHRGIETQHQWSDKVIERTTPTLLGLFSWITLAASRLEQAGKPFCYVSQHSMRNPH